MIVGTEWLIEAEGCNAEKLRELRILQTVFARIISDLGLKNRRRNQLAQIRRRRRHNGFGDAHRIASRLSYISRISNRDF